jgi:hypothetical protein
VKDQITSSHGLRDRMRISDIPLHQLDIHSTYPDRFTPIMHQNPDSGLLLHGKPFSQTAANETGPAGYQDFAPGVIYHVNPGAGVRFGNGR